MKQMLGCDLLHLVLRPKEGEREKVLRSVTEIVMYEDRVDLVLSKEIVDLRVLLASVVGHEDRTRGFAPRAVGVVTAASGRGSWLANGVCLKRERREGARDLSGQPLIEK